MIVSQASFVFDGLDSFAEYRAGILQVPHYWKFAVFLMIRPGWWAWGRKIPEVITYFITPY